MKQTIYRFVSLAIMLVMAASLTVSCGPTEPDPDPTPATVAVTGVSLDKTSLDLIEGGTETLTATVSPDNATNKKVSWKSSDTAVATVDDNGKVTAVKAGSATITVTADGGKTATCSVKVTEQAKIVITGNTAKVPVQGGTAEFKIQYNTSYTIDIEQAAQSWLHFVETKAMQSGTLVFKVDANEGEARTGKATVKDNEGKVAPITLTFEQDAFIAVTSVQIAPETAELEVGETLTLTVTVLPENATDKTVTWSTDNASVATVAEDGTVTAVAQGTATITAAAGEAKASCAITVTPPIQEVERAALIAFYKATGGDKWIHNQNWCSDKPLSEWYGIVLNGYGRVSSIYLYENNLDGQLPSEFFSLSDLEVLERRMSKTVKLSRNDKMAAKEYEFQERLKKHLENDQPVRTFEIADDDDEKAWIHEYSLLTSLPVIFAANVAEDDMADEGASNEYVQKVRAYAAETNCEVFTVCAKMEAEISELDDAEKAEYLEALGLTESGLDKLIKASYSLLGLISYLTAGETESRAWTIKKGTKAPQAAGKIHSDFERGFIKAEIVSYDDLINCGSMTAAKDKGLVRQEGKEYVVQDGDVILFKFNV